MYRKKCLLLIQSLTKQKSEVPYLKVIKSCAIAILQVFILFSNIWAWDFHSTIMWLVYELTIFASSSLKPLRTLFQPSFNELWPHRIFNAYCKEKCVVNFTDRDLTKKMFRTCARALKSTLQNCYCVLNLFLSLAFKKFKLYDMTRNLYIKNSIENWYIKKSTWGITFAWCLAPRSTTTYMIKASKSCLN